MTLNASRPRSPAYPQQLKTIGDHIRQRRLDLGLLQREVAEKLGVDKDSVYYWEKNRYSPSLQVIPRTIKFLGYLPYDTSSQSLGGRIRFARCAIGLNQEGLARRFGVDPGTLRRWELGKGQPLKEHIEKLEKALQDQRGSDGIRGWV